MNFKDLTGLRFNRWTVIRFSHKRGKNLAWMCRCDCGTEKIVWAPGLKSGMSQSCGCVKTDLFRGKPAGNRKDLTGKVIGMLTVIAPAETKGKLLYWACRCECGTLKKIRGDILRNGHCRSCGCRQHQGRPTTPRLVDRRQRPEYVVWSQMKVRCLKPNCLSYKNYGGRGITICERWLGAGGFSNFLEDMGSRPTARHTIERKNNSKGYSPENCKWATRTEQARNKRNVEIISFNGLSLSLPGWAERLNLPLETLRSRLHHCGWSIEKALSTPRQSRSVAAMGSHLK